MELESRKPCAFKTTDGEGVRKSIAQKLLYWSGSFCLESIDRFRDPPSSKGLKLIALKVTKMRLESSPCKIFVLKDLL